MGTVSYSISSTPAEFETRSPESPFDAAKPERCSAHSVAKNWRTVLGGIIAIGFAALLSGNSTARETPGPVEYAEPPHLLLEHAIFVQNGVGSWYGRWHEGRRTANGERFNMYLMTAAHPTLPLGTIVRVTDIATGKQVIVRINDRGPYVNGRIIDLSAAAALALGISRKGIAKLEVEAFASDQVSGRLPSIAMRGGPKQNRIRLKT
jgi:rare lipoprotein A (peptidoglycan hydrolase)